MSDDSEGASGSDQSAAGDEIPGAADDASVASDPSARGEQDASSDPMASASQSESTPETPIDDLESLLDDSGSEAGDMPVLEDADIEDPFEELNTEISDVDLEQLFEEQFTESATPDLDEADVWEEIRSGSGDPEPVSGEEHIVPTRSFCAQCEYAANPPDPRCTYEGSEIVEFVDQDHVRVRNCPIVEERRAMRDIEAADTD